ncbi:MAG: twin-arginine translocase subunit TatC [Trueperaceae bacterium]|nr:twin-arginine translocase subunit TatC [Trueperaceae bacterium]
MTLFDHFEELRNRVFIAVAAWLLASGVMFVFRFAVLEFLQAPLPAGMTLTYFTLLEPFVASMQIASFFGLVLAGPVIVGQVWGFLAPGLYPEERKYAIPFILLTALAFAAGVAFSYYVVLPVTVPVLLSFLGDAAQGMLSIGRYIGNVLLLLAVFGVMFELPVLAFLLARIGIVRHQMLVSTRRYALVILLVLAAAMSPSGDPFNFALVAVPLVILYELSIIVVRFSQRREPRSEREPETTPL